MSLTKWRAGVPKKHRAIILRTRREGHVDAGLETGEVRGLKSGEGWEGELDPLRDWQVVEVDDRNMHAERGGVRAAGGWVRYSGTPWHASAMVAELCPGSMVVGAHVKAGHHGTAATGWGGTASADDHGSAMSSGEGTASTGVAGMSACGGYGGRAFTGEDGAAITGSGGASVGGVGAVAVAGFDGHAEVAAAGYAVSLVGGTSTAGDGGLAFSDRGSARAGKGGEICIRWYDESADRTRVAVAYPGEDGIKPDVFYRYDPALGFVEDSAAGTRVGWWGR